MFVPRVPSDRQEQDQRRQRITWSQLEVGSASSPIVVVVGVSNEIEVGFVRNLIEVGFAGQCCSPAERGCEIVQF